MANPTKKHRLHLKKTNKNKGSSSPPKFSNRAKIKIDTNLCKGCQLCVVFCPKGLLELEKSKVNIKGISFVKMKKGKCIGCMSCAIMCPEAAIEVYK